METQNNQTEKIFEISESITKPDGWITPDGGFYPCTPEEHDECAKFLLTTKSKEIEDLLINKEIYSIDLKRPEMPPREILKAAGFGLLSGNFLSEYNLPEKLTFKQLELIEKSGLVYKPMAGQLNFDVYRTFQEKMKKSEDVIKLLERKNVVFRNFLEDPTKTIHIEENDGFAKKIFDILSANYTKEINLKLGKGQITWRRLDLKDYSDVYLELDYHDHGYEDSYPETESWILLTNKEAITEFLQKSKINGSKSAINLLQ